MAYLDAIWLDSDESVDKTLISPPTYGVPLELTSAR